MEAPKLPGRADPGLSREAVAGARVLVVCEGPDVDPVLSEDLHNGLTGTGYQVLGVLPADLALLGAIEKLQPDVIIIETESGWRDALEHLCVTTQHAPRPIVVFTENPDTQAARKAIAAGVSAYIVAGMAPDRVKPILEVAMARFEIDQALREELSQTRDRLAERKAIDRAKGILMDKLGLNEDEAFRRLRKLAMDQKESIGACANRIIEAARLLG